MNKIFYALSIVVFNLLSFQSFSQLAIPNGDFEKYTQPNSSTYAFDSWSSYMFISPKFTGTSDAHTGNMAMKVFNNNKMTEEGGQIKCEIVNKENNYPAKLKGFVKYAVAQGEKVKISVSVAYTEIRNNQTTTYIQPIGWAHFTGTANAYQPFEILLDYKLSNEVYYKSSTIEKFQIEIRSYDDRAPFGTKVSNDTYIIVDDLSFEGKVNPLPRFTTGVPDGFENWKNMSGILYPEEWINGSNLNEKFSKHFTQSTDAAEGKYALKASVDTTNEKYTYFGYKQIVIDNAKKKLSLKIKYNLGKGDSLTWLLIGVGFSPLVRPIEKTGLQLATYTEEILSLADFKDNSICYLGFMLKKGSANSFKTFVLIDDIKLVDGNSVGVEESENNITVQIHPNPSESGIFEINTSSPLEVYDINGKKVVISTMISSEKTTLYLNSNPRGVYFLKVGTAKMQKLVY